MFLTIFTCKTVTTLTHRAFSSIHTLSSLAWVGTFTVIYWDRAVIASKTVAVTSARFLAVRHGAYSAIWAWTALAAVDSDITVSTSPAVVTDTLVRSLVNEIFTSGVLWAVLGTGTRVNTGLAERSSEAFLAVLALWAVISVNADSGWTSGVCASAGVDIFFAVSSSFAWATLLSTILSCDITT